MRRKQKSPWQKLDQRYQHLMDKFIRFKPAIIYAYSCMEYPYTGKREEWAYVGKTRQELAARHNQHMGVEGFRKKEIECQPWSDLYPEVRVVYSFNCPEFILDLVERWTIKRRKPLYNYIHNMDNPRRITKPAAKAQRRERDLRQNRRYGKVFM